MTNPGILAQAIPQANPGGGKVNYKRFSEWLKQNYPYTSPEAVQRFWGQYTKTGQLPFVNMQKDQNKLEALSEQDNGSRYSNKPYTPAPTPTSVPNPGAFPERPNERQDRAPGGISPTAPNGGGLQLPSFDDPIGFDGGIGDFTDEARQQVSSVYGPQYAALEKMIGSANQNYQRNDPMMEGLYKTLVGDIGANKADVQQRYAGAQTANTAEGQKELQDISSIYAPGAASDNAALMQNMGLQESAAQNQIYAQGQAQDEQALSRADTDAQGDYLQSTGEGYADWLTGVGTSAQTEGTEQRANLVTQLGNILANIEQQRAGISSKEAADVLSLSQTMASQDLAARTQAWQAENDAIAARNANRQRQYENEYGAYKDETNWDLDTAAANAEGAGGAGDGKASSVSGITQALIAENYNPDQVLAATDTLTDILSSGDYSDQQELQRLMADAANNNGHPRGVYLSALWKAISGGLIDVGQVKEPGHSYVKQVGEG